MPYWPVALPAVSTVVTWPLASVCAEVRDRVPWTPLGCWANAIVLLGTGAFLHPSSVAVTVACECPSEVRFARSEVSARRAGHRSTRASAPMGSGTTLGKDSSAGHHDCLTAPPYN